MTTTGAIAANCPGYPDPGHFNHVNFDFRGEYLLDATPSEAEFTVGAYVVPDCAPDASCTDKYRVRISRVVEE
jgi:hypothetical protein